MLPPPGIGTKGKVCCLKITLYRLKQPPKPWFDRLHLAMVRFGFKQLNADHTTFVKWIGGHIIVLLVFVDDMIILGD